MPGIPERERSVTEPAAAMEPAVRAAVAATLAELNAGPDDLALCSGACGGDLIFAEAALACGARLEIHIPFTEPGFLEASVTFAGDAWRRRFNAVKANPLASLLLMPERLGPLPANGNAYARNNLWMLYTALAHGPEKVRFVSLWDGKRGDGEGGTEHMVETVRRHSGEVYVIDTKALLNEAKGNS